MDRPRVGDQHHAESDRANTEISNSGPPVGVGGKNEKTKDQSPPGAEMTNVKAQSSNEAQISND